MLAVFFEVRTIRCLVFFLLGLTAWPLRVGAGDWGVVPIEFVASIGPDGGDRYYVRSVGGRIFYTIAPGSATRLEFKIDPSPAQWQRFRRDLDRLRIWVWKSDYEPRTPVFDGVAWTLDLVYADRSLRTRGSEAYPSARGSVDHHESRAFARFRAAVSRLLGGRKFG